MVLAELRKGDWSPPTVAMALHALRIVSRQRSMSMKLTETSSIELMLQLAGLAVKETEMEALMVSMKGDFKGQEIYNIEYLKYVKSRRNEKCEYQDSHSHSHVLSTLLW